MRLDDLRETRNVEDRRGMGGGFATGGLGLLAVVVIGYFLGVDPSQLLNSVDTGAPVQQNSGAPRADDAAYAFSRKIVGSAEDIWTPILKEKGVASHARDPDRLRQRHADGLRHRHVLRRSVLLPAGQSHLSRPLLLQRTRQPVRRAGRIRAGLCHRP